MREILYIQAGSQANYIGTHFWNTQGSYFACEEGDTGTTAAEVQGREVSQEVSFREGLDQTGESTYCPRLLIFDYKAEFGSLSQANALYGMDSHADEKIPWSAPISRSGETVEHLQEPVRRSQYQIDMEELDVEDREVSSTAQLEDIFFWSDFNRLYYLPRTVQKIPDKSEWEDVEGNWAVGHETFARYDEDTGLMEGPLRLFLEECETFQGIQLTLDTPKFGSFATSLLTSLRDEGTKAPVLALPLLSNIVMPFNHVETRLSTRKVVNDALVLRDLSELASVSIPIQPPTAWPDDLCTNAYMHASRAHVYHTSAILSTHIETATLPLRMNAATDDIYSLAAQLGEGTMLPFSELRGVFPCADALGLDSRIYNFSCTIPRTLQPTHFRRDVTRGFSPSAIAYYNEWARSSGSGADSSHLRSTHAGAYPLPSSFPAFFFSSPTADVLTRPRSATVFSALGGASRGTSALLGAYARFVGGCARRGVPTPLELGLERDDVTELAADLWALYDRASELGAEDGGDTDTESHGEDEE
ncbi:mtDNA inheritance protein Dml1 [Mycena pura]|uniref:MtDNA inheritance protein Dml1 n=1 Tax=Mycena pura TaxID=153505 RepID=A0AAD6VBM3_9AGAR|nr:mtDNA inheritance protein Dml1 [Mycena pura]